MTKMDYLKELASNLPVDPNEVLKVLSNEKLSLDYYLAFAVKYLIYELIHMSSTYINIYWFICSWLIIVEKI